jgi:hypothetical protein
VFANASHLPEGLACVVGAKANVPFAGSPKIELKKMCGGEMLVAFTNSLKKTNKM